MIEKQFISAEELYRDSFELAIRIYRSGFKPNFIVGIWRGGTPIGIVVQETLEFFGLQTDHIAIRTSAYQSIDCRQREIKVHGLQYIIERVNAEDRLLIVDDVYDSGLSIAAVLSNIKQRARRNAPEDIRVATLFYKPERNQTDRAPDYYLYKTNKWLVFPHEINGLSVEELANFKPETYFKLKEFLK